MSTVSSEAPFKYTVHRIVPTERADEIKELFVNNERPEFPQWFDRAYPIAIEKLGASSWVTVDANDRVLCHMAAFKSWFWAGDQEVEGWLLCNLMTDKDSRSFYPTVATVKRAVRDLREDGANFIYTNPINKGSIAVMRAGGLKRVGDENRYLLPLGHRRRPLHVLVGLHLRLRSLTKPRLTIDEIDPQSVVDWTAEFRGSVSEVTCNRYPEVYFMRMGPLDRGDTLGYRFTDRSGAQVGAALVRMASDDSSEAALTTLRCATRADVAAAACRLGVVLRKRGVTRLNAGALDHSPLAAGLMSGGFVRRKEPWTIAATAYTPAGQAVVDGLGASDLEHIDVD